MQETKTAVAISSSTPAALTGNVSVTGTPNPGEVLTATLINTNNTGTLSYQWLKDGVPIAGATGTTLDVPTTHSGTAVYAVTATDAAGHSTTASARIKVISGGTVIVFH